MSLAARSNMQKQLGGSPAPAQTGTAPAPRARPGASRVAARRTAQAEGTAGAPTAASLGFAKGTQAAQRLAGEQAALANIRAQGGNTNPIALTLQTAAKAVPAALTAFSNAGKMEPPATPPIAFGGENPAAPPTPNWNDVRTVNPVAPIPNASGAGAQTGVPAWQTLLSQMPQFQGLFGGGQSMGQGQGNPFANVDMRQIMSLASSLRPGMGGSGQGPAGMMGAGAGAQLGGAGRIGASQMPALGEGQGIGQGNQFSQMLQNLMQSLQGGNQTRFQNTFGGASQFPFSNFLRGGMGFASGPGGGGMGMRPGMGGGPISQPFSMEGQDPRAADMRRLLMSSMFGGGLGGGGGGGLDVN